MLKPIKIIPTKRFLITLTSEEAKIYFKGILANVDASILDVDFDNEFEIEAFSEEEATTLLSSLEKIPTMTIAQKYFMNYQALNLSEHRMYAVSKTIENVSKDIFADTARFDNKWVNGCLQPKIRLMRLFKEGNICMPAKFYYRLQNDEIHGTTRVESGRYISIEPYNLEISEIPVMQNFIRSVKLPFKKNFLNMAFENFELSYEVSDMQLAFLVLMIGLETLLNPSNYEVRYRVSRNTAVLLGENKADSEDIFAQVKELYDRRSEIVHTGERKVTAKKDLLKFRDYLKAIKEIHSLGAEKKAIMKLLTANGFGEKINYPSS